MTRKSPDVTTRRSRPGSPDDMTRKSPDVTTRRSRSGFPDDMTRKSPDVTTRRSRPGSPDDTARKSRRDLPDDKLKDNRSNPPPGFPPKSLSPVKVSAAPEGTPSKEVATSLSNESIMESLPSTVKIPKPDKGLATPTQAKEFSTPPQPEGNIEGSQLSGNSHCEGTDHSRTKDQTHKEDSPSMLTHAITSDGMPAEDHPEGGIIAKELTDVNISSDKVKTPSRDVKSRQWWPDTSTKQISDVDNRSAEETTDVPFKNRRTYAPIEPIDTTSTLGMSPQEPPEKPKLMGSIAHDDARNLRAGGLWEHPSTTFPVATDTPAQVVS